MCTRIIQLIVKVKSNAQFLKEMHNSPFKNVKVDHQEFFLKHLFAESMVTFSLFYCFFPEKFSSSVAIVEHF